MVWHIALVIFCWCSCVMLYLCYQNPSSYGFCKRLSVCLMWLEHVNSIRVWWNIKLRVWWSIKLVGWYPILNYLIFWPNNGWWKNSWKSFLFVSSYLPKMADRIPKWPKHVCQFRLWERTLVFWKVSFLVPVLCSELFYFIY